MSEPSLQSIAGPTRAAWLSLPVILAASCALAAPSASAVEPDRRMAEFERRLTELEGRLLASGGESAQTQDYAEVIAALEHRVRQLEGRLDSGLGTSIKAPFYVEDDKGLVIFQVVADRSVPILPLQSTGGVSVWRNSHGGVLTVSTKHFGDAVELHSNETGGSLKVYGRHPDPAVSLDERGLSLWKEGALRVDLDTLHAALRIYNNTADTPVAVLGVDPGRDNTGTLLVSNSKGGVSAAVMGGDRGAVVVADGSGSTVAQMSVNEEARGIFQVFNAGVSVAALTKGATGGMLQLASDGGVPMVEAGVMANGRGTVRAGPNYKCVPAQGMLNVVLPDCLVGKD